MEVLTGWTAQEANAAPLESVVQLEDAMTREPVRDIVVRVAAEGSLCRSFTERHRAACSERCGHFVDTSAAPIRAPGAKCSGRCS
jgi:hypothetical protein